MSEPQGAASIGGDFRPTPNPTPTGDAPAPAGNPARLVLCDRCGWTLPVPRDLTPWHRSRWIGRAWRDHQPDCPNPEPAPVVGWTRYAGILGKGWRCGKCGVIELVPQRSRAIHRHQCEPAPASASPTLSARGGDVC